jgi:cytoskeleton protein RodZ
LPSFGENLKKEREKRKITIEDISASTKIGTRMLQALEENKFNQLPGGIFNKGFVRSYARFVGIDEDQAVADYLQASGDAPPPSTEIAVREGDGRDEGARAKAENAARLDSISENPSRPLPWGLFAAILLLIALALSLWSRHTHERGKTPAPPTPAAITEQKSEDGLSRDAGAGMQASGSSTTASAGQTVPTAVAQKQTVSSSSLPTPSASPSPSLTGAAAAGAGEFTVLVRTREESWISIRADGKTVPSELLPAGSERSIVGRKEVIVRMGNAGGVDLQFNGKKVEGGGESGEVKTVTFGPRGVVPGAPITITNP